MATTISRRGLLRKGFLATGAIALGSAIPWQNALGYPLGEDNQFIHYGNGLREVKPSFRPDPRTLKARLMANENPFGPSPKAIEAFQGYATNGNFYSWMELGELVEEIAAKEGVKKENIMMGPGSSDLLEKTALVNFLNGGNIVSADPPYMSMINVAKSLGGKWKPVKLTKDYQHDLKAMEKAIDADTKIVYITNPNNPTATVTDTKKLYKFCEKASEKTLVFVDEAYLELCDEGMKASMVSLVAKGKNVVVCRTFSKLHGMAGLRIGYIVANEETLKSMREITRGGMGITGPTIKAASASLSDLDFQEMSKTKIKESREFLFNFLESKGIDYMPSQTNFVMFPLAMDGKQYLDKLYEKSVAVRVFNFWDKTWSRVSIGSLDSMKVFASAFDDVVG